MGYAVSRKFVFDLYRLNVVDLDDLFSSRDVRRLRGDDEIRTLLYSATDPANDQVQSTRTATYKWSLREYRDFSELRSQRPFLHLVLARSVLDRDGSIVTDEGISRGTSSIYPPLAGTAVVFFDLARHLVAVEHTGELAPTAWLEFLEKVLANAAKSIGRGSAIALEPVAEENGIVKLFLSFEVVTRLRLTLRLPNPELTRYTKSLFDDLVQSNIREITQDMRNPSGLSKSENARPLASAVLAEQGYKKGEVQIEGLRNDQFEEIVSGKNAVRGSIQGLRDFVRGIHQTAKAKETQRVLAAISAEIDRIHPARD